MNFSTEALETPPPPRRDDQQPARVHYTHEFTIYQKTRPNGTGYTKRARCNHCQNDWAYNETRLKNHITDQYRGCRRIPPEARERVRLAADASGTPSASAAGLTAPSPPPAHLPAKRKRESATPAATPIQNQPVVGVSTEAELPVGISGTGTETPSAHVRVAVEFSMPALLRATWIAAELITEFHRDIVDVGLIPRTNESTFNIYIGGKIAWSRGVGQPLPDYDHLRPIVRAQCCNATL